MDVDKLEALLKGATGMTDVKVYMRVIAHWVKKVSSQPNKTYTTALEKDIKSLKNLGELGIFEIRIDDRGGQERVTAIMTQKAEKLSKDFFIKGYFLH